MLSKRPAPRRSQYAPRNLFKDLFRYSNSNTTPQKRQIFYGFAQFIQKMVTQYIDPKRVLTKNMKNDSGVIIFHEKMYSKIIKKRHYHRNDRSVGYLCAFISRSVSRLISRSRISFFLLGAFLCFAIPISTFTKFFLLR
jgi:hypothetical protein